MNRMKVFLLLAVMIGFSSCQSRSKQNIEQEVEVDSLSTNPTEEIKIITGVVKDASMNNFMLITLQGDTLFISTMDQEPNDVPWFRVVFEMTDGSLMEFQIQQGDFRELEKGDRGMLTYQGNRYICYQKYKFKSEAQEEEKC